MSDENEQLPEGWVTVKLEELGMNGSRSVDPLKSPDQEFELWSVPTYPTGKPEIQLGADIGSTKQEVKPGDVLLCKINPRINRVWTVHPRQNLAQIASSEWIVFRNGEVEPYFLMHRLREPKFREILCKDVSGVGGSLTRALPQVVKNIAISLPPKAEQTRIVEKIESLQARSSRVRGLLAEVKPLVDQLRQSVLRSAFNGKLTADWRKQNPDVQPASELLARIRTERRHRWETEQLAKYEAKGKKPPKNWQEKYKEPEPVDDSELSELPKGWCWASLGDVANFINGDRGKNYPNKSEYVPEGLPFINTGHIEPDGSLSLERMNYIAREKFNTLGSGKIQRGDLVYCLRGATLGKTAFVAPFSEGAIASSLVIIRPDAHTLREYVYNFLVSPYGRDEIDKYDNGSAQPNLSANSVSKYLMPIPPEVEIQFICRALKDASSALTELACCFDYANSSITQLDQSILSKAFRGELVPQDPSDEPASELLARIRATREQAAAAKKSTKKTRGKKAASKPAAAETTTHKLASWALDLMLLLDAWGKPVPIHCLEPALILMKNDTLRQKLLKTRRSQRQPATSSGPLLTGMKVTLLANLRAGGVIEEVGQNGYKLIDRKHLQQATDEDRDRAAEAIEALTRFMERRELDEPQTRDAVAAMVDSPYELATV